MGWYRRDEKETSYKDTIGQYFRYKGNSSNLSIATRRRKIKLTDPVSMYWPEFAQNKRRLFLIYLLNTIRLCGITKPPRKCL